MDRTTGVLAGWLLTACTPTDPPHARSITEPPASPPTPAVTLASEPVVYSTVELFVDADPVVCRWGSTGVVSTDAPIPYWVIGVVDVTSPVIVQQLEPRQLHVLDARGELLGTGQRERELRVATSAHDKRDLSRQGTTPFTGPLAAGQPHRLWFRVRMNDGFRATTAAPARYTLILQADQADVSISGPIGPPWPTG